MKKTFLIIITAMFFMTGCNEVNSSGESSSSSASSTSSSGQIIGTVD